MRPSRMLRNTLLVAVAPSMIAAAPSVAAARGARERRAPADTPADTPTVRRDGSPGGAGVYRLMLTSEGFAPAFLRLIVEREGDGLSGLLIGGATQGGVDLLRVEEGTLRARVTTAAGQGELEIRDGATGLVGSLRVGQVVWTVSGRRTA